MPQTKEYQTTDGNSPFGIWFKKLNARAAAKVTTAIIRLRNGNTSNVKNIGNGVNEYKVNFGPGYRIYFGKDGEKLIILLVGGSKKRQQQDIDQAKKHWKDYKRRKRMEK